MYISRVRIRNFRNFRDCDIPLNKGLSLLVGPNNIGKSNFLFALALVFSPDISPRARHLTRDDFNRDALRLEELPEIEISCTLSGLDTVEEKAVAATWFVQEGTARITYVFGPSDEARALHAAGNDLPVEHYEWTAYGGKKGKPSEFETKQLRKITFELLGALRDAERELGPGVQNKLAELLQCFGMCEEDRRDIKAALQQVHESLARATLVEQAQTEVNNRLEQVTGHSSAQHVELLPITREPDDLIRTIQAMVSLGVNDSLELSRNGLGYNNLIYVSVLLASCLSRRQKRETILPIMAIEEPEAHLHPHLQKVLNRNFAGSADAQVIATTHSTHIASSVPLDRLVLLSAAQDGCPHALRISDLFTDGDGPRDCLSLQRYLDATKSTLLFSQSVLLVEGIAEALVLPVLATKCASPRFDLDERGISVVAVHGLSFRPFLRLFGPEAIQRRCALLLDSDPDPDSYPLMIPEPRKGSAAAALLRTYPHGTNPFLHIGRNWRTFEYDLAVATKDPREAANPKAPLSNLKYIIAALEATDGVAKSGVQKLTTCDDRCEFGKKVLELIEGRKGSFAQALAGLLDDDFAIPSYVQEAFDFLLHRPVSQ